MQDLNNLKLFLDICEKALRKLRKHLTIEEYKKVVTPHHCCRGTREDMCMFNTMHRGMLARVTKDDNHLCSWCEKERLRELPILKRCGLKKQLQAFRDNDEVVFAKAEQILKEIFGEAYQVQLEKKESREQQQTRQRSGHTTEQWTEALKKRKYVAEAPAEDEEARRKYRKLVLADKKKVDNSFFPERSRKPRGRADKIPEELNPPLPPANRSDLSKGLESWLLGHVCRLQCFAVAALSRDRFPGRPEGQHSEAAVPPLQRKEQTIPSAPEKLR